MIPLAPQAGETFLAPWKLQANCLPGDPEKSVANKFTQKWHKSSTQKEKVQFSLSRFSWIFHSTFQQDKNECARRWPFGFANFGTPCVHFREFCNKLPSVLQNSRAQKSSNIHRRQLWRVLWPVFLVGRISLCNLRPFMASSFFSQKRPLCVQKFNGPCYRA